MRLATFNVENMFQRVKAMNLDTWAEGKPYLDACAQLNDLIQQVSYTSSIKAKILKIMKEHPGLLENGESTYIKLRKNKGDFIKKPKNKPAEIVAEGRKDWVGWFEMKTAPVKEIVTENTARVIELVNADVICIVEAENRTSLKRFNEEIIPSVQGQKYKHIMLIDGNDERGIDVGIMTKNNFEIVRMLSHVDDEDEKGVIFSRDCAEYEITTPKGNKLLLLVNHFKSKGYGNQASSDDKRLRQAKRVREIYNYYHDHGYEYIAILGDLNEIIAGPSLAPLVQGNNKLEDIMDHAKFVKDGRPGTHGNGTKSAKLDYILMSPELSKKVDKGGIERRGVWGGKNGTLWDILDTMKKKVDAASDHAVLWVDLDI